MKYLQIALIPLLLLCLAPMPYGFYILVRFGAMVAFGYMGWRYYVEKREGLMVASLAIALLFQPLVKIALGRAVWNVVNVLVAVFLVWLVIADRKTGNGN